MQRRIVLSAGVLRVDYITENAIFREGQKVLRPGVCISTTDESILEPR